jgi:hypothetical protein
MSNPELPVLSYAVKTAKRQGLTRDLPHGPEDLQWVANTATLIYGERDAVLVDTFTTINQNADLVDWVKSFGRNLTYVYITHAHGDHLFGVGQVLEAFPNAVAIGSAETVADAPINDQPSWRQGFWEKLFPGQIPTTVYPQLLDGDHLEVASDLIPAEFRVGGALRAPRRQSLLRCAPRSFPRRPPAWWGFARRQPINCRNAYSRPRQARKGALNRGPLFDVAFERSKQEGLHHG